MAITTKKLKSSTPVQNKFQAMRADMGASLIEMDDEIDLVLTALIAQEHPLLVGPPGVAKSMMLDCLLRWLGPQTPKFEYTLHKYCTPEELFGPIDIPKYDKKGIYEHDIADMLPEAVLAFIDEVWNGSPALLLTLLKVMNERIYKNVKTTIRCPLRCLIAASNRWPSDMEGGQELNALFDRFLFRKEVRGIQTKAGRDRLLRIRDHTPKLTTCITVQELDEASSAAKDLSVTEECFQALHVIIETINKEGIFPSGRRLFKSITALQAYAFLSGSNVVLPEHCEILSHVLWDDPGPDVRKKVREVVGRIANPTGMILNDKRLEVMDILNKNTTADAITKLEDLKIQVEAMPEHVRKATVLSDIQDSISFLLHKHIGIVHERSK